MEANRRYPLRNRTCIKRPTACDKPRSSRKRSSVTHPLPSEALAFVFFKGSISPADPLAQASLGWCVYVKKDDCTGALESALYTRASAGLVGTNLVPLLFFAVDREGQRVVLQHDELKRVYVERFGGSEQQCMAMSHYELQDNVYTMCCSRLMADQPWPDFLLSLDDAHPGVYTGPVGPGMQVLRALIYTPILLASAATQPQYAKTTPRLEPDAGKARSVLVIVAPSQADIRPIMHVIDETDVPLEARLLFDWLCTGPEASAETAARMRYALAWCSFFKPICHTPEADISKRIETLLMTAYKKRMPTSAKDPKFYKWILRNQKLFDRKASPVDQYWQIQLMLQWNDEHHFPSFWTSRSAMTYTPGTQLVYDSGPISPVAAVICIRYPRIPVREQVSSGRQTDCTI